MEAGLKLSVVIATYDRRDLLARLLEQLATQTLVPAEVVVVDDGSHTDVAAALSALALPYVLHIARQANQGAAVARHRGATIAAGDVLVFLDDDMRVEPGLLAAHAARHAADPDAVVLGRIRPDTGIPLTLFERFHARVLERFADDVIDGRRPFRGTNVWSGNLSMRRDLYFDAGGFDPQLSSAEDAELGIRLEKCGAHFVVSEEAASVHSSDHASTRVWMRRARGYGSSDRKIAGKHPDVAYASPWRYFSEVSAASRPLLASAIVAPRAAHALAMASMAVALAFDRTGVERAALAGATLTFGIEYMCGLRDACGGTVPSLRDWMKRGEGPLADLLAAVEADHRVLARYDAKYARGRHEGEDLSRAAVRRIGLQMMVAVRAMQFLRASKQPHAADVLARLIRHAYGADIHPHARIAPGVVVVHGMGLAISRAASVASGVILFQNVTLGEGTSSDGSGGAPTIERDVHVGPGATIVGPVTIGARSKVMAGCVVRNSVPPDSLVSSPNPSVRPRGARATANAAWGARS